jgi:hypothetical protein
LKIELSLDELKGIPESKFDKLTKPSKTPNFREIECTSTNIG